MTLRVDVAHSGDGGPALLRALREAGVDARAIAYGDVPSTHASCVVIWGKRTESLEAIRRLRDDGAHPDTPVVLLGTPEGTGPSLEGPGFGAEVVLADTSSATRVLRAITKVAVSRDDEVEERGAKAPERTMQLAAKSVEQALPLDDDTPPPRDERSSVEARPSTGDHSLGSAPTGEGLRRPITESGESRESRRPITGSGESRESRRPITQSGESRDSRRPLTGSGESRDSRRPITGSGESRDSRRPITGETPRRETGDLPREPTGVGYGTGSAVLAAPISEPLKRALLEAERRVFPLQPSGDVSLPRGDERAAELVPEEFLDFTPLAWEDQERDREAVELTFVGSAFASLPVAVPPRDEDDEPERRTHPGTPTSLSKKEPRPEDRSDVITPAAARARARASRPPSEPERPSERPPALEAPRIGDPGRIDASLPKTSAPEARRGSLRDGALLGLLVRLGLSRTDGWVELDSRTTRLRLALARGELVAIDGAFESTVATTGFARERALREQSELALGRLLAEAEVQYVIERPTAMFPSARWASRSFLPLLAELARRHLGDERVRRWVGGADVRFAVTSRFDAAARELELAPELVWLVREALRRGQSTLGALRELAPDEPGIGGALFVLHEAQAVELSPASEHVVSDVGSREITRSLEADRALAADADYFALVGIAPTIDGELIARALTRRRQRLFALPLADAGLARLEPVRQQVLAALDDAERALASSRLRAAYVEALARPPMPGRERRSRAR